MKRKGIATQFLERVCKDATDEGFDFIEAYPNSSFVNEFCDFMGPLELYKKFGFTVHEELENICVMRKELVR